MASGDDPRGGFDGFDLYAGQRISRTGSAASGYYDGCAFHTAPLPCMASAMTDTGTGGLPEVTRVTRGFRRPGVPIICTE
jgi:hypothetical protein